MQPQEPKPKVYIFLYEECPISIYMTSYINDIRSKYGDRIKLYYVYPHELSNYKTVMLFNQKYGIVDGEIILDEEQTITNRLGANITPEAFVLKDSIIIYQGRINDGFAELGKRRKNPLNNDLVNAIEYVLSNDKPIPIVNCPKAVGCYITRK